ncbi:MAG: DeoR/GlpR family DNA-binding transcription regulator, partial [Terracidiphilus sp.]
MSTKTDQRAKRILQVLLQHGNTSVDELAALLSASAASVRRDLTRLEERGLVHRTHGGAKLAGQTLYEPFRFDSSFQEREIRFAEEKRRIGIAAAELIREHETIGFTAGTTTTQVARCIRHRNSIHIITNAVNIGMELNHQASLNVTLTGGTMRWAGAFSLTGPTAMEMLSGVFLDRAFIGACGVDVTRGATTIEPDEAAVFRAMVRQAKQVIVVADSSKIAMVSPALICPVNDIDILVT